MKKIKVLAASAIFIVLTLFKIILPAAAYTIKCEAAALINYEHDIKQVVSYIDSRAASHKIEADKAAVVKTSEKKRFKPETIEDIRNEMKSLVKEKKLNDTETASSEPDIHEEAVRAFLLTQIDFESESVPANVSYDYIEVPFDFTPPVGGMQSSGFGFRMHPVLEEVKFHYGTDIAANTGCEIIAFASGTVTFSGFCDSFGNYITIDHGEGWQTLYAHCSENFVSTGESIEMGERIALVGATGQVTGPHLHFELSHNGVYVNPEYYVNYI